MQILRTPNPCFEDLPDWQFAPRYTEITDAVTGQTLRLACVDEGM